MMQRNNVVLAAFAAVALLLDSARAAMQIAKGGEMCAGYDDSSADYKIYYGPCESAETVQSSGNPYFTAEVTAMGLISGTDTEYLTNDARADEIQVTPAYEAADMDVEASASSTYAYVTATGRAGDTNAYGYLGTAFYLAQTGTISTSTNEFPEPDDEANSRFSVCITEITNGVCGAARTWSAGNLKFSLFGVIGGPAITTSLDGKSYIGFRQKVTLHNGGNATATFNDGVALGDLNGADVTKFRIHWDDKNTDHEFPTKYNVGSIADCNSTTKVCSTTAANSFTRTIKIKASAVEGEAGSVYLDYLFAVEPSASDVNDGLKADGRYFVYDPDVTSSAPSAGDKANGATATVTSLGVSALAIAAIYM